MLEKKETEYRRLTVESVSETEPSGNNLQISFVESWITTIARKGFLAHCGLENIASGDVVEVRGKDGNDDKQLWGYDTFAELRKAV
ncbi:MAG: hypothetical protein WAV73_05750 [Candidatus Moraniibacteriota bacterium]